MIMPRGTSLPGDRGRKSRMHLKYISKSHVASGQSAEPAVAEDRVEEEKMALWRTDSLWLQCVFARHCASLRDTQINTLIWSARSSEPSGAAGARAQHSEFR